MIDLLGRKYITDKEAAFRYGFSQKWFVLRRSQKKPPAYIKLHGKVLYDLEKTDEYFQEQINKDI
jgi:hypothetical protein